MRKRPNSARLKLVVNNLIEGNRTAPHVHLRTSLDRSVRQALQFNGAEPRDDIAPLPNGGVADPKCAGNRDGASEMVQGVFLEHVVSLTTVAERMQPHFKRPVLTSVAMGKDLDTLAARLRDAMGEEITASALARACGVSPAAVGKWLDGGTKELKAATLEAAARSLGVSPKWLRTGQLPRERDSDVQAQQTDRVMALLAGLSGPLRELVVAIDELNKAAPSAGKSKRHA
jgi:transcriptional regulator with XRE-family HTH domain